MKIIASHVLLVLTLATVPVLVQGQDRQLYWGDTHVHSSNSFDAYLGFNRSVDPATAYRYAAGLPVIHPYHRARVQIETPLDFLVVADHAELMGTLRTIDESGIPGQGLGFVDTLKKWFIEYRLKKAMEEFDLFGLVSSLMKDRGGPIEAARPREEPGISIPNADLMASNTWRQYTEVAEAHNAPGQFTAMIGWEWTSGPGGANLHRVVFTDADGETARSFQPYSSFDSAYPEDLWAWLEKTSAETNSEFVAIPHNSNISKGFMFPQTTIKDQPVSKEYAQARQKWEPVAEITQYKGDSETVAVLSPNDEFADFETYGYFLQSKAQDYEPTEGDYLRGALKRGLEFDKSLGINPYKYGVIGSTDSHTGLASAEENNFHGKFARDSIPDNKSMYPEQPHRASGWAMSAQGLAAVWADRNDRQSIMAAFKRREVYATTGPRISLRFFGGWNFSASDLESADFVAMGYGKGVPMGGDLPQKNQKVAPNFLIMALRDPVGANLDRVQVVKGWLDSDGQSQEKVFDVAWAGERIPNAAGKIPAIGNTVNEETADFSNIIGTQQLSALWTDPSFDPKVRAFYYIRALQIPTARHSLYDAIALQIGEADRGANSLQERAYSSPIWYMP
ncbi:MAG: DUF3604 domain-containing protein [Pseudomonadales bacterium]